MGNIGKLAIALIGALLIVGGLVWIKTNGSTVQQTSGYTAPTAPQAPQNDPWSNIKIPNN